MEQDKKKFLIATANDIEMLDKSLERAQKLGYQPNTTSVAFVHYLLWLSGYNTQFNPDPVAYVEGLQRVGWTILPPQTIPAAGDLYVSYRDPREESLVGLVAKIDLKDQAAFVRASSEREIGARPDRSSVMDSRVSAWVRFIPKGCAPCAAAAARRRAASQPQ